MAILRHVASGEEHFLSSRHLIGRAPSCQLRVEDPGISGFHAELSWDGERWNVKDLGSRNGTALGDRTLAKGEAVPLSTDTELLLAGRIRFQLIDDSAPHLVATSKGEVRVAENELLCLPDDEDPQVTIYRDIDGQWLVESDAEVRLLSEAPTVITSGRAWQVLSPRFVPMTYELSQERRIAEHVFRFRVSRDGEHVELTLERGEDSTSLEPRAHLALWLVLARERLRDTNDPSLPASEHGWVYREDLCRALDIQAGLMKLWIHRGRRQLAQAGIRDAAAIIERRATTTQVRIGATQLIVEDG